MPDVDLRVLLLAITVIGGQLLAFAVGKRPASAMLRILLVATVVVLFLITPIWWAILTSILLTVAVFVVEPLLAEGQLLSSFIAFAGGFLAMVPVVYAILWTAQHTVGRYAILPALFGSSLLVFGLFFVSVKTSFGDRLVRSLLMGASVCLSIGGVLSVIVWNAFTT